MTGDTAPGERDDGEAQTQQELAPATAAAIEALQAPAAVAGPQAPPAYRRGAEGRAEYQSARTAVETLDARIGAELPMLADSELDFSGLVEMTGYRVGEQNLVGTRLPILEHVEFAVADYSRLATPAWVDILVKRLKDAAESRVRARIAQQRVQTLDQAVRRITQRVNLFEKILIPTAKKNIQRIRIYLGDAERAAVVTSKLAKVKQQAGAMTSEEKAI